MAIDKCHIGTLSVARGKAIAGGQQMIAIIGRGFTRIRTAFAFFDQERPQRSVLKIRQFASAMQRAAGRDGRGSL